MGLVVVGLRGGEGAGCRTAAAIEGSELWVTNTPCRRPVVKNGSYPRGAIVTMRERWAGGGGVVEKGTVGKGTALRSVSRSQYCGLGAWVEGGGERPGSQIKKGKRG